jgi:hypothetical protein
MLPSSALFTVDSLPLTCLKISHVNIRPVQKYLISTNTLAYYCKELIAKAKGSTISLFVTVMIDLAYKLFSANR